MCSWVVCANVTAYARGNQCASMFVRIHVFACFVRACAFAYVMRSCVRKWVRAYASVRRVVRVFPRARARACVLNSC